MKYIIASTLISVGLIFSALNVPTHYLSFGNDNLGIAALTDITSSDTLANFPTVQNANNTAIENAINTIEGTTTNSTITTLSGLTTATGLVTVGTIGTGVWQGTDVGVAYGGTGASSLDQYQLLLGSSTNAVYPLGSVGTSGQFLTSGGAGAVPSWTTSSVDGGLDYTWTGYHTFGSAEFTLASSTDFTVGNDLTVTGGIGTTTAASAEFTDVYVSGGCYGCTNVYTYSTTTGTIVGDYTETVTVGFRPYSIEGFMTLDANTNTDIGCVFTSHGADNVAYFDSSGGGNPTMKEAFICESDQGTDDLSISITAISDTGFTINWNWITGQFNSGTKIRATIIGQ